MAEQAGSCNINKVFSGLKKKNHKAFIPFLTCGFPDPGKFYSLFEVLDRSGADIIEIGIPFSDPLADGPVIQETSKIALGNGINTDMVLTMIGKIRKKTDTPMVILSYFNTVYSYGIKRFLKKAEAAGVRGLIIPDLPLEEYMRYKSCFTDSSIDNIMLASLTSGEKRLAAISREAKGFLYCVSVKGVTGAGNVQGSEVKDFLKRLRLVTELPLALGFGLRDLEQIKDIKDWCDGVIVGSKILSLVLEADSFKQGIGKVEEFASNVHRILKT